MINADTKITNRQRAILNILACGGRYSVADLTIKTGYCDVRSYIKILRDKGFDILDNWITADNGKVRFKVYYLSNWKSINNDN